MVSINNSNEPDKSVIISNITTNRREDEIDINFKNAYIVRNHLGKPEEIPYFNRYDLNSDGHLDGKELTTLKNDYENRYDIVLELEGEWKEKFLNKITFLYNSVMNYIKNGDKNKVYKDGQPFESGGEIGSAKQGNLGDCWLLTQINALSGTDFGRKAIKDSIKHNKDGSYTIKLKNINEEYTFSLEEVQNAIDHNMYSQGDLDVILLEMAFEKHYNKALDAEPDYIKNGFVDKNNGEKLRSIEAGSHTFGSDLPKDDFFHRNITDILTDANTYEFEPENFDFILKQKAKRNNKIAISFSSNYAAYIKDEKVIIARLPDKSHASSIKKVNLDKFGNIESVVITNPWNIEFQTNNGVVTDITVDYEDFKSMVKGNIAATSNDKKINSKLEKKALVK